jgi:DNA-binding CsgD family transcriptional regulator
MIRLRSSDYRAALHTVQKLAAAADDVAAFAHAGVDLLPALVAADLTTLSICDLASGRRDVIAAPGCQLNAQDRAAFDRHFHTHPLVRFHAYEGGRVTRRISDSVPFKRFRHSALYDEYYRRIGLDHALALPIHVDDRWLVSFVLNRARRDFTDRECALLDLTRAGLSALYRRALTLARLQSTADGLRDLLDASGASVVRLDLQRRVCEASPTGAVLLSRYGDAEAQPAAMLPPRLTDWLDAHARNAPGGSVECVLVRHGDRLHMHAFAASGGALHLVLEERLGAASAVRRAQLPLTEREREVLRWVAAGKTDRDIAAILAISPRTVHKHLQRVYDKLGVETRTAAVMRALTWH